MAIIGVRGLKTAVLDESTNTYKEGQTVSDTIDVDLKINNNDAKLYADDQLVESDSTFKDGDIAIQLADIDDEIKAKYLGHKYNEGETIYNKDDTAPYVGLGFYAMRKVHNVVKFRAIVLLKVKFSEPSEKYTTKGDSISFQTPTINGKVSTATDGVWKKDQTFDTEEEAQEYIDTALNITSQATNLEDQTADPEDETDTE